MTRKWTIVGLLAGVIIALDLWTKSWALEALGAGERLELFGGAVPLTLAFNQGAAFGLRIGSDPRWVFIPITVLAIVFLLAVIARSAPGARLRVTAAALVLAGAAGNLYDRIRWDRGVVDFIGPIDLGFMLWPIFNVADMAITTGALLLAVAFWREEVEMSEAAARERAAAADGGSRVRGNSAAQEG